MHITIDKHNTVETLIGLARVILELEQRIEDLERNRHYGPLTEVDRSHHVVIGARVDSSHTGV